jgi:hypothetical protein
MDKITRLDTKRWLITGPDLVPRWSPTAASGWPHRMAFGYPPPSKIDMLAGLSTVYIFRMPPAF